MSEADVYAPTRFPVSRESSLVWLAPLACVGDALLSLVLGRHQPPLLILALACAVCVVVLLCAGCCSALAAMASLFVPVFVNAGRRRTWAGVLAAALTLAAMPALAGAADSALCESAIRSAELARRLPRQLLTSIGVVESGRPDPLTGRVLPWPWTINVGGKGYFFASRAEAIAATQQAQSAGVQSIDVGCMQVNLMHHPDAFASLEQAFEPAANAAYAASFLSRLFAQYGAWPAAAAAYHSATPELAEPYRARVMAYWPLAERYGKDTARRRGAAPDNGYTREFRTLLAEQASDHAMWVRMGLLPDPAPPPSAGRRRPSRFALNRSAR